MRLRAAHEGNTLSIMSSAPAPEIACPSSAIRVAIVDDDKAIREGLEYLIERSPGFQCVAACADAEEAVVGLLQKQPDVVLMDIQLPGMNGIECIRRLKQRQPSMQIMMLTVLEDHDRIFQSLAAGASGYLLKKTPPDKLLDALRDLHAGGSPMSNQIARRVVEAFQKPARVPEPAANLTEREFEILNHLAQGKLYKEIAETLGIRLDTVRTHVRHIYEKLHVRTRMQAVLKVFKGPSA